MTGPPHSVSPRLKRAPSVVEAALPRTRQEPGLIFVALQVLLWLRMGGMSKAAARRVADQSIQPSAPISRITGWLVENGGIWTLCNIRSLLPPVVPVNAVDEEGRPLSRGQQLVVILRNMAISLASGIITEQGSVLLLHLVSTRLYPHVKHFGAARRSAHPLTLNAYADWSLGNGKLQMMGSCLALGLIESFMPAFVYTELEETPFRPARALRNFLCFRVVVDLAFYLSHRQLHVNPFLYKHIHRRHHEHYTTNLRTNYHFHWLDLFIESAFPIWMGFMALRGAGVKLGRFEINLFMTAVGWHESGTHLGKPLPVISWCPPLSILWNLFQRPTAIEFHEVHHNRRHCNYGITEWIDFLAGTRVLRPQGPA